MTINKEKTVLSVETATRSSSLALMRGTKTVLALWHGESDFSASDNLLLEIKQLLLKAGTKLNQVDLLAATLGPGSFTGLRIGLSVVKGLAAGEIPIIGVPTLPAMAFDEFQKTDVCVILPAGRDDFFSQTFRTGEDSIKENESADKMQTGDLETLLSKLANLTNLKIIAPNDFHLRIQEFNYLQKNKPWILAVPPENLALSAGRLALQRSETGKSFDNSLIYGRAAIALKKQIER